MRGKERFSGPDSRIRTDLPGVSREASAVIHDLIDHVKTAVQQ